MGKSYVYIFLDPRKEGIWYYKDIVFFYQPFYVGEGKYNRIKNHFTPKQLNKNSYKNNIIKGIISEGFDVIKQIIYKDLLKEEALLLEQDIISTFGRKYNKSGILTNIFTFGNSMAFNLKYSDYKATNEEATKKAAKIKKGKTNIELYGEEKAKEIGNKISKTLSLLYKEGKAIPHLTGKKAPKETRDKISKSLIGNKRRLGIKHSEKDRKHISEKVSEAIGKPVKVTKNSGKVEYYSSINKAANIYGVSAQMLDEAFKNKNFCNSKKCDCKFELITKKEYNLHKYDL